MCFPGKVEGITQNGMYTFHSTLMERKSIIIRVAFPKCISRSTGPYMLK